MSKTLTQIKKYNKSGFLKNYFICRLQSLSLMQRNAEAVPNGNALRTKCLQKKKELLFLQFPLLYVPPLFQVGRYIFVTLSVQGDAYLNINCFTQATAVRSALLTKPCPAPLITFRWHSASRPSRSLYALFARIA